MVKTGPGYLFLISDRTIEKIKDKCTVESKTLPDHEDAILHMLLAKKMRLSSYASKGAIKSSVMEYSHSDTLCLEDRLASMLLRSAGKVTVFD